MAEDSTVSTSAEAIPEPASDPKIEKAKAIVATWRNEHFNSVPSQAWDAYAAVEPHLITAIAASL